MKYDSGCRGEEPLLAVIGESGGAVEGDEA